MKAMKDIPMFCAEVIFLNQLKKKLDKTSNKLKVIMLGSVDKNPESKELLELITNLTNKLDIKGVYEQFKTKNDFEIDWLNKHTLFKFEINDIVVNFEDKKIELLKEIKYFTCLRLEIEPTKSM